MLRLINLELKKNNIRSYVNACIIITIIMLGMIYLFAYAPKLEPNDIDMKLFAGYNNILALYGVIHMSIFCVLASVMYTKFIITEYTGKRTILLFSYPINRRTIMLSKIMVVSLFTIIAMFLSNLFILAVFGISETIAPIVEEQFTLHLALMSIRTTFVMALSAISLSIVATGIGFIKKSVPTTIISAVIGSSLLCNIVANSLTNQSATITFMLFTIVAGIIVTIFLISQANRMEVE